LFLNVHFERLMETVSAKSLLESTNGSIQNDSGRPQGLPADFAARSSGKIDRMQEE
jgi:hypothetical protein